MDLVENQLRLLLAETGAYHEGHFEIGSGQHTLSYYNCERLLQYPSLASRAVDAFFSPIQDIEANFVFTPSISAVALAFEIARRTTWQFALHALPFTLPDYHFPKHTRVLVVEDVVTSGRSLRHAREWCSQRGAEIAAYAVLVDRRSDSGGNFEGNTVISGFMDPVQVFAPDECPACHDTIPLDLVSPNYRSNHQELGE